MALQPRFWRRRQFLLAGASFGASVLAGCGMLFHPERRGQPAGQLDWKIVALDALGLILFLIPGIIAFAVDFSTGTIYLPPGGVGSLFLRKNRPLVARHLPRDKMNREQIEAVVSAHVGRPIDLTGNSYSSQSLNNIDNFWPEVHRLTDNQPGAQG